MIACLSLNTISIALQVKIELRKIEKKEGGMKNKWLRQKLTKKQKTAWACDPPDMDLASKTWFYASDFENPDFFS